MANRLNDQQRERLQKALSGVGATVGDLADTWGVPIEDAQAFAAGHLRPGWKQALTETAGKAGYHYVMGGMERVRLHLRERRNQAEKRARRGRRMATSN